MESDKLYPDLNLSEYKQELDKQKIINFQNDLNMLKDKLNHYNKLHSKWKKIDNVFKYSAITLGAATSISAIAITSFATSFGSLMVVLPLIASSASIGLTSFSAISTFINTSLSFGLSKKRKKKYHSMCKILNKSIDELFAFHQKALRDEELDELEIKLSKEIVRLCIEDLEKIKSKPKIKDSTSHDKLNAFLDLIKEKGLELKST